MQTDTYYNLPRRMRWCLAATYHAQSFRWSAPVGWMLIVAGLVLIGFSAQFLFSSDSRYRPVDFASEELHLWEAYAKVHRPELLPLLAGEEDFSRKAKLSEAWVSEGLLKALTSPIVSSSPLPAAAEARISSLAPNTFARIKEQEALRLAIRAGLTSWTTCPAPSSIFGPSKLSATPTRQEISCDAIAHGSIPAFVPAGIIAALLGLALLFSRLMIVILWCRDSFIPEPLLFGSAEPLYSWLEARGDNAFARLESLFISLSLPFPRPSRSSPSSKASRL